MSIVAIPKKIKNTKRFVTIPRQEYEELLVFKKYFPVVEPSVQELRAIRQGRKEIETGNYTSWEEAKHELANIHNRSRQKANGKRAKA
ncbi:MAG: hypothetical protein Q8R40_02845 [bacterium]|nr:hypothetical protein [bacterium]